MKVCKECGCDLVGDVNIHPNQLSNSDYICRPCRRVGYVPTGNAPGRPSWGRSDEEMKELNRAQTKEERERKNIIFPPGVYGVFRNDKLVYIGESLHIWSRIYGGHFKYNKQNTTKQKMSILDSIVTRDNIDEFKWGYLAFEDDLNKRLIIESQYITRHAPRLNAPYRHLPTHEYNSLKTTIDKIDVGDFIVDIHTYYPANKTLLVPDGYFIKRIGTY